MQQNIQYAPGDRVWAFIHYRWFEGVVERVRYGWYTVRVPELNREINLRRSVLYPADFAPFQYSIGDCVYIDPDFNPTFATWGRIDDIQEDPEDPQAEQYLVQPVVGRFPFLYREDYIYGLKTFDHPQPICGVCLEDVNRNTFQTFALLPCNHAFCQVCVPLQRLCPLCMYQIILPAKVMDLRYNARDRLACARCPVEICDNDVIPYEWNGQIFCSLCSHDFINRQRIIFSYED